MESKITPSTPRRSGFVLILNLVLMAFVLFLVLALASLVRVELYSSIASKHLTQSRQNALMALQLALGELQTAAGPDRRITGSAELAGHETNPKWTGVWPSEGGDPVWLVSGELTPSGRSTDGRFGHSGPG